MPKKANKSSKSTTKKAKAASAKKDSPAPEPSSPPATPGAGGKPEPEALSKDQLAAKARIAKIDAEIADLNSKIQKKRAEAAAVATEANLPSRGGSFNASALLHSRHLASLVREDDDM